MDKILYNNGTHLRLFFRGTWYSPGKGVSVSYSYHNHKIILAKDGLSKVSSTGCIKSEVACFVPRGFYKLKYSSYETMTFHYAKDFQSSKGKREVSMAGRKANEKIHRGSKRWNIRNNSKEEEETKE